MEKRPEKTHKSNLFKELSDECSRGRGYKVQIPGPYMTLVYAEIREKAHADRLE